MLYYRVETVNVEKLEIRGGYMAALDTLLLKRLNLKPGTPVEELAEAVERSADPEVQELWISASLLCDIPYPDEYSGDRKNTVCLYNEIEYEEAEPAAEGNTEEHGEAAAPVAKPLDMDKVTLTLWALENRAAAVV